ncbi:MAG: cytochrome ubiquinol oxidase subunit [Candidatus Eremiobacteraeota bacterium]|nr:cytochrome ubiquinol oxidase subunit [Candidatus Eremiobacteraeota bacterium]
MPGCRTKTEMPTSDATARGRALARAGHLDEALAVFLDAVARDDRELDAHLGIYEVAQILRRPELALEHQAAAIALAPVQSTPASKREDYALLVPCAPGPYTANMPADLLFDSRYVTLHRWYVDPAGRVPRLPEHDAIFVAIGESDEAAGHLRAVERFLAASDRPVLNRPELIARLGRVPLAETLATARHCRVVTTTRIARARYAADGFPVPHIVRPVGSHGGHGLERIDHESQRAAYLAASDAEWLYVAPFIDYSGADGFFRKYRIVFVGGEPYAFHLAISPYWMVHYYNAPMAEHQWMRDEEHAFLARIENVFTGDLAAALRETAELLPLDYVGIDCDRPRRQAADLRSRQRIDHPPARRSRRVRLQARVRAAHPSGARRAGAPPHRRAAAGAGNRVNDGSLDPADWDRFRRLLHEAVDGVVDDLAGVRDQPAWRPVPDTVKAALREPLPRGGEPLETTLARFDELIRPYPTGNRHPRFFGWVHGAGNAAGVMAELLAAGMNANAGGREHAAVYVERAVVAWFAELFGFPHDASGILTSGTSMGNLLAVVAARDAALRRIAGEAPPNESRAHDGARPNGAAAPGDDDPRETGIAGTPLTAYAAFGVHDSVAKALRIAGLGTRALRHAGTDETPSMDPAELRERIAADRAAGQRPFLVIATAGSVDTGAFDRIDALADLCAAEGLWLHVDGAFGALAIASPAHAHLIRGIDRADSLAFDAHKWVHAPYAVGCVLFRDERAHRAAFASEPAYLGRAERGTAAGSPWYADYGLELSREFRALKLWFTLRHYGIDALGASIAHTCDLAAALANRVQEADDLELLAPVVLNVVCFRYRTPGRDEPALNRLNDAIAIAVQESGAAVLSTTRIGGKRALRACIVNHRTRDSDLDAVLHAVRIAARDAGAAIR